LLVLGKILALYHLPWPSYKVFAVFIMQKPVFLVYKYTIRDIPAEEKGNKLREK
jgi:hypothetical protein